MHLLFLFIYSASVKVKQIRVIDLKVMAEFKM